MAVYAVSDVHGCYTEFKELLALIEFDATRDTVFVLGDAIDRGEASLACVEYIRQTPGIEYLQGNHDKMMLDYFAGIDTSWCRNGNEEVLASLKKQTKAYRGALLEYIQSRPMLMQVVVGARTFLLSHAGLDVSYPLTAQDADALVWSRGGFYRNKALETHICVFGHTPTWSIRHDHDCSVWFDPVHKDKIGIDCGCVFGGALAALRLEDLEVFYVKSTKGKYADVCHIGPIV